MQSDNAEHVVLPAAVLYASCAHAVHAALPALYDPAAHWVHVLLERPYPVLHNVHVLLVFPVTPSAQLAMLVHDDFPCADVYPVCGHSAHALLPSLYDPAAQTVHVLLDKP